MFSEFSDKGKEALGKAYFLTGLIPACVAVIGFLCVLLGPTAVIKEVTDLIGSESKTEITWTALSVLVVSFVLTVIREAVVTFFENTPGKPFILLRDWLISRALKGRHTARTRLATVESEYTVVEWLAEKEDAEKEEDPPFIPELVCTREWEETRRLNNRAFACACRCAERLKAPDCAPQMSAKEVRIICEGLLALFVFETRNRHWAPAHEEKKQWIEWVALKGKSIRPTLEWMLDFKLVESAEAASDKDRYPEAVKWIKPTALGNRFSALQDYAEKRYRVETSLLWERVWWVLPKEHRKEIGATRTIIESLLVLNLVFILLSVFAAAVLAAKKFGVDVMKELNGVSGLQMTITLFALVFFAFSSYRLSLVPADSFVRKVQSLIDIYRAALLHAVGMEPGFVQEELEIFEELGKFWLKGEPRSRWRTVKAAAADAGDKKGE